MATVLSEGVGGCRNEGVIARIASQELTDFAEQARVLMICYAFPPTGGAGVQRSAKFAKYLSDFGWRPTVLTVSNPSVPVLDQGLLSELPNDLEVIQARTWEPSYRVKAQVTGQTSTARSTSLLRGFAKAAAKRILQPDPQRLWNFDAFRQAKQLFRREPSRVPQLIYVSGPPFSSFLLGYQLKKKYGRPLVLDFRDEWLLASSHLENYRINGRQLQRQQRMLNKVLDSADVVITTTQASRDHLQQICKQLGSKAQVQTIYNGYDEADLARNCGVSRCDPKRSDGETLKMVYAGTLWNLTDIAPFVRATQRLGDEDETLLAKLSLEIVGRATPQQDAQLERLASTPIRFEKRGYVPHDKAISVAASSDVLLLLLSSVEGAERVVPAKMFEYLALQKEILAIVPKGECWQLLSNQPGVTCIEPDETDAIVVWLRKRIGGTELETPLIGSLRSESIKQYSRRHQAGQLATLFKQTIDNSNLTSGPHIAPQETM